MRFRPALKVSQFFGVTYIELLNAYATGNPFILTNLLEVSIGRGLSVVEGLNDHPQKENADARLPLYRMIVVAACV